MATLIITTMAILLSASLIVMAHSTSEEEQTTGVELPKQKTLTLPKPEIPKVEVPGISKGKKEETEKKKLDERSTFDFSLPGNNRTQSLALFFERPFKFSKIEGKLSGNYFTTFTKQEIPPEESVEFRRISLRRLGRNSAFGKRTPGRRKVPIRFAYTL